MQEIDRKPASGGVMLVLNVVLYSIALAMIIGGASSELAGPVVTGVLVLLLSIFLSAGFFIVQPNQGPWRTA
jgi:hypothetical protein